MNADDPVNEEIRQHLDDRFRELRARGVPEADARALVADELEEARARGSLAPPPAADPPAPGAPARGFWRDAAGDLRFAARMMRKSPGFAAIVVLTLALGIGANTALFSVVDGVLLRRLPFPHPEELVVLHESKPNFANGSISFPNFKDWRDSNRTFQAIAVSRGSGFNLTGRGQAEQVRALLVSADFFSILGVRPAAGRLFRRGEDEIGAAPIVAVGEGFWRRRLDASPGVIGQSLTLDGRDYVIVGIVPASFELPLSNASARDVYVPIGLWSNPLLSNRASGLGIHGIGRLKPGVTIEQARADMAAVSRSLTEAYPAINKDIGASVLPMADAIVGPVRPYLFALAFAVAFVLLIACANVSNLLLARSVGRQREFAVRAALGASPARVLRQLVVESVLLALAGGMLGLILAAWGARAAIAALPTALPWAGNVGVDVRVLLFTLAVAIGTGLVFGLAPAWRASRPDVQEALKDGARGASGASHRTQASFVVAQTALAVVLLVGAGLMVRTLGRLWSLDIGFRPDHVLTFGATLPPPLVGASADAVRAAERELHDALAATPSVVAASLSWGALPLNGDDEAVFWPDGQPRPMSAADMGWALRYVVEPDYLTAMRISLVRGRFFSARDDERAPLVAVVDDVFARKFFPGQDPIGRRINVDAYRTPIEIVGEVGHVNQWGLDSDAVQTVRAQLYLPFMQLPDQAMRLAATGVSVVVRTDGTNPEIFESLRRASGQLHADEVLYGAQTMEEIIAESLAARRFAMIVFAAFAAAALVLASLGIYGVLSHVVAQRTHELGIRLALGARTRDVAWLVVGQGTALAAAGAAIGLAAAAGLTRLMRSLLFGVNPIDPPTFAAVAALLIVVALVACWLPARRATRTDPLVALRG